MTQCADGAVYPALELFGAAHHGRGAGGEIGDQRNPDWAVDVEDKAEKHEGQRLRRRLRVKKLRQERN